MPQQLGTKCIDMINARKLMPMINGVNSPNTGHNPKMKEKPIKTPSPVAIGIALGDDMFQSKSFPSTFGVKQGSI